MGLFQDYKSIFEISPVENFRLQKLYLNFKRNNN